MDAKQQRNQIALAIRKEEHLEEILTLLKREKQTSVCSVVRHAQEILTMIEQKNPDVLVLDFELPGLRIRELCAKFKAKNISTKAILIGETFSKENVSIMVKCGASGLVIFEECQDELLTAVQSVLNGNVYLSKAIGQHFTLSLRGYQDSEIVLSPREIEVLTLIAHGYNTQKMSNTLFISIHTINSHRKNLMAKLKAKNASDLVRIALENDLI